MVEKKKKSKKEKKQTQSKIKKVKQSKPSKSVKELVESILQEKQPGAKIMLCKGTKIFKLTTLGKKLKDVPDSLQSILKAIAIGALEFDSTTDTNLEKLQQESGIKILMHWNEEEWKKLKQEKEASFAEHTDVISAARSNGKSDNVIFPQFYGMIKTLLHDFAQGIGIQNYKSKKITEEVKNRLSHFLYHHVFEIKMMTGVTAEQIALLQPEKPVLQTEPQIEVNPITHMPEVEITSEEKTEEVTV